MQIRTPRELGALIRDQRRRRGLDQQDLASKIGVSRQWVVAIEQGKARAEVGLVLRALDALGVALSVVEAKPQVDGPLAPEFDIDRIVRDARGGPR